MQDSNFTQAMCSIAMAAGDIIMKHFDRGGYDIEIKNDNSPVTQADIEADIYISAKIKEISDIKIISEEGVNNISSDIKNYFLIDPLDGTKSFINGSDEFTVNIGLIENGKPVFGVIYQPPTEMLYFTKNGKAYKQKRGGEAQEIKCDPKPSNEQGYRVIASKSHLSKDTEEYIKNIKVSEFVKAGSSLKFCMLAEGLADIYPRFAPTMQWDTAAGQAILNAAGGSVKNPDSSEFDYHLSEDKEILRNGYFIAKGWQ